MKNTRLILVMIASTLIVFTSCKKEDALSINSATGTYLGTLTQQTGIKSVVALSIGGNEATATVSDKGNGQISVRCIGTELDTTFMLNYYHNYDSLNVCVTGDAFQQMYGHMMQNGNGMGQGGMMNGTNTGNVEWMNHMGANHKAGDKHFGGFDLKNQTFGYTIKNMKGEFRFQGKKQ